MTIGKVEQRYYNIYKPNKHNIH